MEHVTIVGIDVSKERFQVQRATAKDQPDFRKKLSRGSLPGNGIRTDLELWRFYSAAGNVLILRPESPGGTFFPNGGCQAIANMHAVLVITEHMRWTRESPP